MSPTNSDDGQIAAVRAFNRFYTRKLGVLDQQLLKSPFSLSEARVLYELAHREELAAKEIGIELGLDPGYLSRIVQKFDEDGLITRKPLASDRRQYRLGLTARGRQAFAKLERSYEGRRRSHARRIAGWRQSTAGRGDGHDRTAARRRPACHLVQQSCAIPGRAIWDGWCRATAHSMPANTVLISSFEGLVAEIAGKFLTSFDASRERCWIAEIDGAQVGSVFLVRHSDDIAKLRLLLVDPAGRGQGLGQRLVGECIAFARACGYRKITLWTQSILFAARKIYQDAGFVLVATEPHRSFGQDLIGETWEREL